MTRSEMESVAVDSKWPLRGCDQKIYAARRPIKRAVIAHVSERSGEIRIVAEKGCSAIGDLKCGVPNEADRQRIVGLRKKEKKAEEERHGPIYARSRFRKRAMLHSAANILIIAPPFKRNCRPS